MVENKGTDGNDVIIRDADNPGEKGDKLEGFGGDDVLTWINPTPRFAAGTIGLDGGAGDDILEAAVAGFGQVHMWGRTGNDTLIINLTNTEIIKSGEYKGHQSHHAYGGVGSDTFHFTHTSETGGVVIGRIDDFDISQDRIMIDDQEIDLNNLPSNVRIVNYQSQSAAELGFDGQQFLIINDNIFYALEGARQAPGSSTGEEVHFLEATEAQAILAAPDVAFIDQKNYVSHDLYAAREASLNLITLPQATITGTAGNDQIHIDKNGPGDRNNSNIIYAGAGDDVINGGQGYDTIYGEDGDDLIAGGLDADMLYGGSGNDRLWGGSENDVLHGGAGQNTLDGGMGQDTAVFDDLRNSYTVSRNGDVTTLTHTTSADSYIVENVELFEFADGTLDADKVLFERETNNLVVDGAASGAFGNRYRGSTRVTDGVVSFTFESTDQDLQLSLSGYDVDSDQEVGVYLNGSLIGYLEKTGNNSLGASSFDIAASDLQSGTNQLEFRQSYSKKSVWGVNEVSLKNVASLPTGEALIVDGDASGAYGNQFDGHEAPTGLVRFTFESTGQDLRLDLQGYDVDVPNEVEVLLNGTQIGYLNDTNNNAFGASSFSIAATDLQSGINQLDFRQTVNTDYPWGVKDVSLKTNDAVLPQENTLVVDGDASGTYGNQFDGYEAPDGVVSFAFASTGQDLKLDLQGYDVDFTNEVEVLLNGAQIGYLEKTGNNRFGASSFEIAASDLRNGINQLDFRQAVDNKYSWGVKEVRLTSGDATSEGNTLVVDGGASGSFGNRYGDTRVVDGEVNFIFESTGQDLQLNLQGYDVDSHGEVEVFLNGTQIGYLEKTNNNAHGASSFDLAASDLQSGSNELQFHQALNNKYIWGVNEVSLSVDDFQL